MDKDKLPKKVKYSSEYDREYSEELKAVTTEGKFVQFLQKWDYWIEEESKSLIFSEIKEKIDDCRKDGFMPSSDYSLVLDLLMPPKLLFYSLIAAKYGVPWGVAFIQYNLAIGKKDILSDEFEDYGAEDESENVGNTNGFSE